MRKLVYSNIISIVTIISFLSSSVAVGMPAEKGTLRTPLMHSSLSPGGQRERSNNVAHTLSAAARQATIQDMLWGYLYFMHENHTFSYVPVPTYKNMRQWRKRLLQASREGCNEAALLRESRDTSLEAAVEFKDIADRLESMVSTGRQRKPINIVEAVFTRLTDIYAARILRDFLRYKIDKEGHLELAVYIQNWRPDFQRAGRNRFGYAKVVLENEHLLQRVIKLYEQDLKGRDYIIVDVLDILDLVIDLLNQQVGDVEGVYMAALDMAKTPSTGLGDKHAFVPLASGEAVLAKGEIGAARLLQDYLRFAQRENLGFASADIVWGWKEIFQAALDKGFRFYGDRSFLEDSDLLQKVDILYARLHEEEIKRASADRDYTSSIDYTFIIDYTFSIEKIQARLNELIASTAKAQLQPAVDVVLKDKEFVLLNVEPRVQWAHDHGNRLVDIYTPIPIGIIRIYNSRDIDTPSFTVTVVKGQYSITYGGPNEMTGEHTELPGIVERVLAQEKGREEFIVQFEAARGKMFGGSETAVAKAQLQDAVNIILGYEDIALLNPRVEWKYDNRLVEISITFPRYPRDTWIYRIYNFGSVRDANITVIRVEMHDTETYTYLVADKITDHTELSGIVQSFCHKETKSPAFQKGVKIARSRRAQLQPGVDIIVETLDEARLDYQVEWGERNYGVAVIIFNPLDRNDTWQYTITNIGIDEKPIFEVGKYIARNGEFVGPTRRAERTKVVSELPRIVTRFVRRERTIEVSTVGQSSKREKRSSS